MTTSKLIDNNRRVHAAKVLAQASKKNQSHESDEQNAETSMHSEEDGNETSGFASLNQQYGVIREDILKLREDLAHGYDLLKNFIETKVNLRTLIRAK